MTALWIIYRYYKKDLSLPKTPITIPWLIFLLFCFISIFVAAYPALSLRAFFSKNFSAFLFFCAIYELFPKIKNKKISVVIFLVTLTLTIINGFIQYFFLYDITGQKIQLAFIHTQDVKRVSASFPHPNEYGTFLISTLPLLFSFLWWRVKNKKELILYGLLIGLTILSLYLTESRGAAIALIIAFLCVFSVWNKKMAILFLVSTLFFILFSPLPLAYNTRNAANFNSASSGSLMDRLKLWSTTMRMIKERPLLGWGLNNYSRVHPRFAGDMDSWYPHNCYLQMTSEIGIFGTLAFLGLLITMAYALFCTFKSKQRTIRIMSFGFLISLLGIMFHASVDTTLYSLILNSLFWALAAFGLSLTQIRTDQT